MTITFFLYSLLLKLLCPVFFIIYFYFPVKSRFTLKLFFYLKYLFSQNMNEIYFILNLKKFVQDRDVCFLYPTFVAIIKTFQRT